MERRDGKNWRAGEGFPHEADLHRLVVESSRDFAILAADLDARILVWNPGAERVLGWSETEALEGAVHMIFTPEDREQKVPEQEMREALEKGRAEDERWHLRRDGSRFWASGLTMPLRDANGQPRGFVKILRDRTEARRADEALRTALAHQEVLMREVSHRVKNSLALVASLLSLQARVSPEATARAALEEARARVATVARVHDQLWRGTDVRIVDLAAFLGELCEGLRASAPGHALLLDVAPVSVSADDAIPVGLIVNELVTNAFKYAYPGGAGEVQVRLDMLGSNRLRLEVSDRGAGLPEGFDLLLSRASLGMRLVTSLARQLGGEMVASSQPDGPGARFILDFPRR